MSSTGEEGPCRCRSTGADAEVAARAALHAAMIRIQGDPDGGRPAVVALVREGDRRGWPEVSVVGRYIEEFTDRNHGHLPATGRLDTMWRMAQESNDPALVALVLAYRSRLRSASDDVDQHVVAGTELARAVVLLEDGQGRSLERVAAHIECAVNFGRRRFWELERHQYELARAIDPIGEEPALAAHPETVSQCAWAPIYNTVELETRWASACCVVGDEHGQHEHAEAAGRRYAEARTVGFPALWMEDLRRTVLLARALGGENVADEAAAMVGAPTADPLVTGGVLTARAVALAWRRPDEAARAVGEALRVMETVRADTTEMDLLHFVAALVEGSEAGMRFGLHEAQQRWNERQVSLSAMEASLRSERWRTRSEELERHAHLDPLTGLANRRGFARYLERLVAGDSQQISVVALDIDRFKRVNDTYGHSTGDETLARLGAVLANLVRPGDLAARLGGDEFVLLLDGTDMAVALQRAATIRDALAFSGRSDQAAASPTVSIGVASGPPQDLDRLMTDADRALYEAKSAGGNRSVGATAGITTG